MDFLKERSSLFSAKCHKRMVLRESSNSEFMQTSSETITRYFHSRSEHVAICKHLPMCHIVMTFLLYLSLAE